MNVLAAMVATGCSVCIAFSAQVHAQEPTLPKLEPPERLAPYTNIDRVLSTAKAVVDLLATAKFQSDEPGYFAGACNTAYNHSVVRGYELAKTSYYLFGSKMELDWYDAQYQDLALSEPYRGVLAATWKPLAVADGLVVLKNFQRVPGDLRKDLRIFLSELLRYRAYHQFLYRRPEELQALNERINETCGSEESKLLEAALKGTAYDWKRERSIDKATAQADLDTCKKRMISGVQEKTNAYRELINQNRNPDVHELDHCLDGQSNYYHTLVIGQEGGIIKKSAMSPNYFLIKFWMRRKGEGTEKLATFAIEQTIAALQDSPE